MKQIVEEPLSFNLPDKEFFDLCHERYGVNRGVYNVIDHWFFRKGFKDIEARRNTILHFLAYLQKHQINKFGKGGVKNSLELYMTNPSEKEVG